MAPPIYRYYHFRGRLVPFGPADYNPDLSHSCDCLNGQCYNLMRNCYHSPCRAGTTPETYTRYPVSGSHSVNTFQEFRLLRCTATWPRVLSLQNKGIVIRPCDLEELFQCVLSLQLQFAIFRTTAGVSQADSDGRFTRVRCM